MVDIEIMKKKFVLSFFEKEIKSKTDSDSPYACLAPIIYRINCHKLAKLAIFKPQYCHKKFDQK